MPRTKKKKGGWQPGDPVDGSKRLMSVTKAAAPCKAVEYAVNTVKDLQQKIENIPATFSKIMPDGKLCGHVTVPSLPLCLLSHLCLQCPRCRLFHLRLK